MINIISTVQYSLLSIKRYYNNIIHVYSMGGGGERLRTGGSCEQSLNSEIYNTKRGVIV